jgi:hypothetical protein
MPMRFSSINEPSRHSTFEPAIHRDRLDSGVDARQFQRRVAVAEC